MSNQATSAKLMVLASLKLVVGGWCCQNKPVTATTVIITKADIQRFSKPIFIYFYTIP
ncbi:hypothetical protein [Flavobacterium chungnamense]|uniref:hypothetical protein n=1 Tax=Flavobacterium chungnamense TaxID=706182 RepID=UPI0031EEA88B